MEIYYSQFGPGGSCDSQTDSQTPWTDPGPPHTSAVAVPAVAEAAKHADEDVISGSETESETEPEITSAVQTMKEILAEMEQSHARLRSSYARAKINLAKERRRNGKLKEELAQMKAKQDRLMTTVASIMAE